MQTYFAESVLLPSGWERRVRITVDGDGWIARVERAADAAGAERLAGPVLPGMPNLHSHAFQRAMAGLAERRAGDQDSFWSWRDLMYRFVSRLTPELARAVAAQLYVELLKHGYTAVAEFHYVHRRPDGHLYDEPHAMAAALVDASRDAGIAVTVMPALYAFGGFGEAPLLPAQRRFASHPDEVLGMLDALAPRQSPDVRFGVAPHSLRAVSEVELRELLAGVPPGTPIHMHVAEQTREVADCVAWSGERPLEWLLARFPVDEGWCLIHCTHMTEAETDALAASGAVAGLCPTTEANLGDGLFPLTRYLERGGRFGIGSDSHVSRNPAEELRWLEYGQRLVLHRRNVAASAHEASVGTALWRRAVAGGAQAVGRAMGEIAPGRRADLVVLDPQAPALAGLPADAVLDALVFAADATPVRDVMAAGHWQVRDGRHARETEIAAAFVRARQTLLG
jgi:formimidoylglutamate deiminase